MSHADGGGSKPARFGGLTGRGVAGIVVAVGVLVFIAVNRHETKVSFVFFTAKTALWVALAIAAAGGFVAGFLISRRHYRD